MSTASSKSVDEPKSAEVSKLVEEGTSSASPSTSTGQQQTAGDSSVAEEVMSSSPAASIDQKSAGPSTTVEGQLRKRIARLEADIHQLKLDQDPNREALKHTFLRDELAQLRETNLDLRVELQVAQESVRSLEKKLEKHQVLGSELERCKQLMQKAIDDLSTGFKLSNTKSPNLGLATEAVQSGASLLPQQPVSSGPVETATLVSHAFESNSDTSSSTFPTSSTDTNTLIKFGTFGLPPSHPSKVLFSPPSASQTDQPPTVPPFPGTASTSTFSVFHPLATKASSTVTGTDSNSKPEPAATPKRKGALSKCTSGSNKAQILRGSYSSPSQNMFQGKNEPKLGDIREGQGEREGHTMGIGKTLVASDRDIWPRVAKPE